ncbi:putative import inner membrane translocase subunit TIM50 [Lyophyllum shimeji]|uniref:Mitochondrial import inner membrane translocase subunit TIM50 n=1 Tax=Lyophyllum shimeji TaxID=47721 RepID=A0A9P3PL84_LYOSH|nr:putative import inner membrane translocase subunit TIM50 [Lyophyllum shimeji]
MFAVLTRTVPRRVLVQSVRCMANKPPTPPSSSSSLKQGPSSPPSPPPPADSEPPKPSASTAPEPPTEPTPLPSGSVPSLDFAPPDPTEQQQRTGARSSKGSLSSAERRRRNMGRLTLALLAVAFGVNTVYMGREWDDEELKAKKMTREEAPSTWWGRTKERFTDLFDYFNKPAWPELLPPPYPPPHQKPYTLLISIDDLLVTSTWDRQHGWRTAKRPGVDYFLAYISQFYEVVVFTTQNYYTAGPILDKLDRYNFYITHRLFREATRSMGGKIVKDLSYLNRDLSKVVMLDTDPEHVSTHPENAVVLPKWKGDPKDNGLIAMIPFLESIAIYRPPDVRPILTAYHGKNIPLEYAKKEAEAKARHIEEWKNKKGVSSRSFSSLFGLSGANPAATPTAGMPPTYLEQKRREAQMQYQEEQKYIAEHREELEKLLAQEQQAMVGEVPGTLWEAFEHLKGKPKKEEEGEGKGKEVARTS